MIVLKLFTSCFYKVIASNFDENITERRLVLKITNVKRVRL